MDFLNHREGVLFSIRFSSFLRYSVQGLNRRNCKRLREFEEIEISRQSCRGDCIARRETLKTFVWISSKNSASGMWRGLGRKGEERELKAVSKGLISLSLLCPEQQS
jgi:hypothetical protein